MNFPDDLKYTKEHEWVKIDGDIATIGITSYAIKELGDIVYVDLPEDGEDFDAEEAFGAVESTKAVSDIYMPVSGSIDAVNEVLDDSPETLGEDPYGEGWLVKIKFNDKIENLLTADEYKALIGS